MLRNSIYLALFIFLASCSQKSPKHETKTKKDSNGFTYEYVTNDPLNARIYTLKNGLKVFLTNYEDEPRIQTQIGFNTGGANDPENATGLAHYLEHMLFKGTSEYGTIDYESEKPLLDSIEVMFEHYRTLDDEEKRKAYYSKIDSVSQVASQYTVPNEYDKLMSMVGATGTNAYTNNDQTVYINDIPANELERWLQVERNRFQELVPRLFHTELETVYEEKNQSLDNDYSKTFDALNKMLYPGHPYGTQTVIGTIDHLKNPSITEIKKYFDKYYVPDNALISMSGDIDYDETIKLIDKYFGDWESDGVSLPNHPQAEPVTEVKKEEVYGPDSEFLYMGYRIPGSDQKTKLTAELADMVMNNSEVGLIDLNLIQNQKVLRAGSFVRDQKDHDAYIMYGNPREGQSLDDVKNLLLAQIDSLRKGAFSDEMLEAIITDLEVSEMRSNERNWSRASTYLGSFRDNEPWINHVSRFDSMRTITKQDIMDFAQKNYRDDNYVIVYKRNGEDTTKVQIEKPQITEIDINRDTNSVFFKTLKSEKPERLKPVYVDYEKDIQNTKLGNKIPVYYTKNKDNSLFTMYYLLDMGRLSDPKLNTAVKYLEYLGTDSLSAEEIKSEMYRLGCSFRVYPGNHTAYISLNGLEKNLAEATELFEHLLSNVEPDEEALDNMITDIIKEREDNKKSKFYILYMGLNDYGTYGKESPGKYNLSKDELEALSGDELTGIIKDLLNYEHRVLYYGAQDLNKVKKTLEPRHYIAENLKAPKKEKEFEFWKNDENEVYWTHYDMVQTELMFLNINRDFDEELLPLVKMYNEYFSGSMGSIVFQEMREGKALAYSAYASYSTPYLPDEPFKIRAFIGTQADKLPDALPAMVETLNNPPASEKAFENAKEALMSQIESERVTKTSILFNYETARRMGYDTDIRKAVYEAAPDITLQDVLDFQKDNVKDKNFRLMVLGDKDKIDFEALEKYGPVKELKLEEIFGY
ncbi:M16 family metallopeptidase [Salibacter halophilus]|uniref:Insulinase family protein n=1 Tax=Salibacter halophilus TaxID=1803916 RepID=A0A6N6M7F0_9FLAO|nr:insulinase family protein [Salibacter halophilus]KAB1064440.1 insulinase family protein [Salibacter halophilus]